MPDTTSIADISQAIQLSIAPVFLLVAIAAFINAFVARLARVVDRSRSLSDHLANAKNEQRSNIVAELSMLEQRARLVHLGMTLGITTALLVCLVVVVAFIEAILGISNNLIIGGLFIAAMVFLIGTLLTFLREVLLAIRSLPLGRTNPGSAQTSDCSKTDKTG